MNIQQLRHFVALAEELHFGKAAQRLHISQPPLSQSLARLEAGLGMRLFERTRRSVALTAAGEALLAEVRPALQQIDRGIKSARKAQNGLPDQIEVGFVSSAALSVLPQMVRIVESTWPTVKLRFRELPSELQAQRLLDGTLDVGLMHVDEHSDPNFRVYVITEEVPLIALPVNSPLARRRRLKLSDLREVPTILFPRDQRPDLRAALDMSFQRLGFMPNVVHEATSMVATLSLVSAGLGIAYTTDLVGQMGYPGVTFRRITGLPTGFSQDLRMVWMPQPKTSQLTAVLEKIAEGFLKKTGTAPQS